MPEIVSDGGDLPFQLPLEAANQGYLSGTNPGLGKYGAATVESGPAMALAGAAERGTQAGASWYDRALAVSGLGLAGLPIPEPAPTPTMSPDDYNEQFAPRDVNGKIIPIGDQPMPEGLARIVGRQKSAALERESTLQRFEATHSGLTSFAAGSAAAMLDPLNLSMNFMPGLGEGALAARLGGGLLARTTARLAAGAATGALLAAPGIALHAALDPEEATDYGMREAMRDLLYSAAGMAVFHAGIGGGLDLLRGEVRAPRIAPEREAIPPVLDAATQNAAMKSTIGEIAEGRPVDVTPVLDAAAVSRGAAGDYLRAGEPTTAPSAEAPTPARYTTEPDHEVAGQFVAKDEAGKVVAVGASPQEAVRAAQQAPRAMVPLQLPDYARPAVERDWATAQRLGVIDDVERLAAEGKTAADIAGELGARLDAVRALARANNESERAAAAAFVRNVRNGLGIPSLDQATEYAAWKAAYDARTAAPLTPAQLAAKQRALNGEGWAPGTSRDELAAANEAVYGRGEAAPAPAERPAAAPAAVTPEEVMLEQQLSQLPPELLHPEDRAELARADEAVTEAGTTLRDAFTTAAQCLLGLGGG